MDSHNSGLSKTIITFITVLLNSLQNLDPGRVQVFVRIRPLNDTEDVNKHPQAVTVADEENTQVWLQSSFLTSNIKLSSNLLLKVRPCSSSLIRCKNKNFVDLKL